MRVPHRWTRTHRGETSRERALCDGRRAVRAARRQSAYLALRPFSDKYGYDRLGGGDWSNDRHNDDDGSERRRR